MRDYLIKFFRDFEYEERDAKTLLATFDTINKKEDAKKLLFDALSVYEANHKIDYAEEIIGRAKKITELTDTHPYTVEFLLFVCMTKRLKVLYEEKDLNDCEAAPLVAKVTELLCPEGDAKRAEMGERIRKFALADVNKRIYNDLMELVQAK